MSRLGKKVHECSFFPNIATTFPMPDSASLRLLGVAAIAVNFRRGFVASDRHDFTFRCHCLGEAFRRALAQPVQSQSIGNPGLASVW
jgi:hypothetical protein